MTSIVEGDDPALVNRKATEKQMRLEGQALWEKKKEFEAVQALQERNQLRELLKNYNPWGAPGHGAPIPGRLKKGKLILGEPDILEESDHVTVLTMGRPGHGAPIKSPNSGRIRTFLNADPSIRFQFHESVRKCVDNSFRYRVSPIEKETYRRQLDALVREKRKGRQQKETHVKGTEEQKKKEPVREEIFQIKKDGVELLPILIKHRTTPRRTLPTTDVTDYEKINNFGKKPYENYSKELENQIQSRQQMFQAARRDDIEKSVEHFNTWRTFWGRPGNGAPKGKFLGKQKLDALLYRVPVA